MGMILIDIQQLEHELVIPMDIINLLIATTLHIEYDVEPKQLPRSYFSNYGSLSQSSISQHIQVMNNIFNHILTMQITVPIYMHIIGLMMMMILSPLIIQHGID